MWSIIYSNNEADIYEANLMRRLAGLLYIDSSTMGDIKDKIKIAVARCARVSYLNFEGNIDHEKDYDLHDKLAEQGHWSPFEHCASPLHDPKESSGNFLGWHQYRKSFQQ